MSSLTTLLRKIPFFSKLGPAELREVYKISRIREYGPGESIFTKSQAADQMFIVLNGRVKIFSPSSSKKRKTFAYLQPGDFFGEMALLEGKPRSASAEASEFTKLLIITKRDFERLLVHDHPQLSIYLLRTFSARLRRANEEIEGLLFRNILGRVAKTLNDLGKRGEKRRGGIQLVDHYTQQELADLVGTTREPLTRALSALRRAQLVENLDGRYFIKDPAKLEAICLVEP
jgi:CRP/FNR family transcriptional regulator, cyclic AMP receptor protein